MYKKLKIYLKRYTLLVLITNYIRKFKNPVSYWVSDVRSAFFSKSTKIKLTPYGFKLLGTNSVHHLGMQKGIFEIEETALFQEIFKTVDIFVDVGANIGYYSCLAKQANLHVIAVEPLQKNLKYLYTNFLANNWNDVEIFPVGLAQHSGLATLYGGSSTGASLIANWAGSSEMFRENISLSTLDVLIGNRFSGEKIFIKIDVEGGEYQTLLGAINTMDIQPKPTWVVEICLNEYHPEGKNPNFQAIFDLFWLHGYEARTADMNNKLISIDDVQLWVKNNRCDSGTINYKFVSSGSKSE